jgi:putative RNA 2'-phosphotransferase
MGISNRRLTSLGKFLTKLLRHSPELAGLDMDGEGWVSVEQLLANTQNNPRPMTHSELLAAVDADDKGRFALKDTDQGQFIRCVQGHNKELNVALAFELKKPPATLYHGTPSRSLSAVMASGLQSQSRKFVHLTESTDTAQSVAKRYGTPVLLEIASGDMFADGYEFKISENKVWLIESVPSKYIKRVSES